VYAALRRIELLYIGHFSVGLKEKGRAANAAHRVQICFAQKGT